MIGKARLGSHPRRAATFVAVGAVNTVIDVAAFACFYQLAGLDVILSNVLAFLLAVTNSYIMNFLITFADRHSRRGTLRSFARFLLVAVLSLCVSTVIVYLLSMLMHPMIAKLVATGASTVINYCGSYRFVFCGDGGDEARASMLPK